MVMRRRKQDKINEENDHPIFNHADGTVTLSFKKYQGILKQLANVEDFNRRVIKQLLRKIDSLRRYCEDLGYDIYEWEMKYIEVEEEE